jgi:hypothetical protein
MKNYRIEWAQGFGLRNRYRVSGLYLRRRGASPRRNEMVRLSISLVLAAALTLAGVALACQAFTRTVPFEFVVSGFAIAAGLTWLWAVIKEWRAKE